jgi:MOSC domain-containing protein YiiM
VIHAIDPDAYDPADAAGTVRALGAWWAQVLDGRDAASTEKHLRRCVEVIASLGNTPPAPAEAASTPDVVAWLDRAATSATSAGATGSGSPPPVEATSTANEPSPIALAEAAAGAVSALVQATAQLRWQARRQTAPEGTVAHLHRGNGGVPKASVDQVEVGGRGVIGDRQANRRHHGRPWQALCIWSAEVIESLAAEGHPIEAGSAGENITVRGIPWDALRPGTRLRLPGLVVEVSLYALPCAQNARWFSDRDFNRMHHRNGPVSRVYGFVVEPGRIAVGDPVRLEPI